MSYQEIDWYDTPHYYDIIFDSDTLREADFLEDLQACYGESRGRSVLEPACGSGRLVAEMNRRGWSVTGLDLSEAMLTYARERLKNEKLKATLKQADMSDFRLRSQRGAKTAKGQFDLAHCTVSSFKYLLTEKAARSNLLCVAAALKPGGIYALGFHLTDYEATGRNRERWVAERDGVKVVCNIQGWPADIPRRLEKVRSRLVVQEKDPAHPRKKIEKRAETNWMFRTYDAAQVRRLLKSVPELELVATHNFDYRLDHTTVIGDGRLDLMLVLRKK